MADFHASKAALDAAKIDVVAASVDSIEDARKMIDAEGLTFAVGYGLVATDTARLLGGFYEPDPDGAYLQPVGIVIDPSGTVVASTYSSASIGRLIAKDVIAFVEHA